MIVVIVQEMKIVEEEEEEEEDKKLVMSCVESGRFGGRWQYNCKWLEFVKKWKV